MHSYETKKYTTFLLLNKLQSFKTVPSFAQPPRIPTSKTRRFISIIIIVIIIYNRIVILSSFDFIEFHWLQLKGRSSLTVSHLKLKKNRNRLHNCATLTSYINKFLWFFHLFSERIQVKVCLLFSFFRLKSQDSSAESILNE